MSERRLIAALADAPDRRLDAVSCPGHRTAAAQFRWRRTVNSGTSQLTFDSVEGFFK
jgi:hypothetical protein